MKLQSLVEAAVHVKIYLPVQRLQVQDLSIGGAPLNRSDMIISHERMVRIDRKKVLLQKKNKWESAKKTANDALAEIAKFKDTKKKDAMDISD